MPTIIAAMINLFGDMLTEGSEICTLLAWIEERFAEEVIFCEWQ